MNLARTWAVAVTGLDGRIVEVEADLGSQIPGFTIIGLADRSLVEAEDRVRQAAANSGLELSPRRITVNLAPAEIPKHGAGFDLAIALAALAASGAVPGDAMAEAAHIGELGLDGSVRPVRGLLAAVLGARQAGFTRVFVPRAQESEAELVEGIRIVAVATLREAAEHHGAEPVPRPQGSTSAARRAPSRAMPSSTGVTETRDLADLSGQDDAVEAAIIAAAGGHHLALSGPPGSGKTMLAERLPGILPELTTDEAIEVAAIHSLTSPEPLTELPRTPPWESPHHSISAPALLGGGSPLVRPGAITRAHRGVLFLDEAAEFSRTVLDGLRQPLESGLVDVQRARGTARFPAAFLLVLALNPCPCGRYGDTERGGEECRCTPDMIRRYAARISGPLWDRVDLRVRVQRVRTVETSSGAVTSAAARERVRAARERAAERLAGTGWRTNAEASGRWLRQESPPIHARQRDALDQALERGQLTMRGYDRVLRLAWTLADLDGADRPGAVHVGRALYFRSGGTP